MSARRGTLASRRSTAAVYWPRARLGETLRAMPNGAVPFNLALVHSHVPLVVAEGSVSGASRELRARQRAGRRIPSC